MTLSACPSFAFILVPGIDTFPIAGMGILLAGAVALDAHIGVGMTGLARLQIPPHLRGMIRIPVIDLRAGACLAVGFDFHVALVPLFGMAVRTEFRLMAAIAVLWVVRRLDGMDGDKIGPMRPGHILPSRRRTPRQIRFDAPALVAIDTKGLLMAIRTIIASLLGQQSVLRHEKRTVIAHDAGTGMAIPTLIGLVVFEAPVVGPGE